jgi:hypothetical protein
LIGDAANAFQMADNPNLAFIEAQRDNHFLREPIAPDRDREFTGPLGEVRLWERMFHALAYHHQRAAVHFQRARVVEGGVRDARARRLCGTTPRC